MEPLSAFSVACNVLQVIEVGAQILSRTIDYRKASDGLLAEHRNLGDVARSLNNLNADLQASLPSVQTATKLTPAEIRLIEANNECLRISTDFLQFLERLKVRNKNAVLDVFRASIKSVWHKDAVVAMEKAVRQARDNLNLAFLVFMNSKQSNMATQSGLETQTTKLESNILQAVTASSGYIHDELQNLSSRLDRLDLGSAAQGMISDFLTSHHSFLQLLSTQLDSICAMNNMHQVRQEDAEAQEAERKIMASLHFPQMQHRKHNIHAPHDRTFQWVVDEGHPYQEQKWSHFLTWLRAQNGKGDVYWIHGKPGSGKSSLVTYLDNSLSAVKHMQPWADYGRYVQASFYFWSSGDIVLQKSVIGMMRSILYELIEQVPEVVPRIVSLRRWRSARSQDHLQDPWTERELREMLQECLKCIGENSSILLLLDGLDEIKDTEQAQENLVDIIQGLTALPSVKICVSSRPLPIFRDAFGHYQQLRLQDLTYDDISIYVKDELNKQASFRALRHCNPDEAESIIQNVISAADGVFLWVRLVVKELIRCLRDGNGLVALERALYEIPRDLDAYFGKMMASIEPEYRLEASVMLQVALWEEEEFTSLTNFRLLDLSYAAEGKTDFSLLDSRQGHVPDFSDVNALRFRLDSTFRKLQSRCKGFLECSYSPGRTFQTFINQQLNNSDESEGESEVFAAETQTNLLESMPSVLTTGSSNLRDKLFAFDFTVDFLHRSLRDFLLTPESQDLLERYSNGPFDARRFKINARLAQARSVMSAGLKTQLAAHLVSHVICALATPQVRRTEHSVALAARAEPVIEKLMAIKGYKSTFWYIDAVLSSWHEEDGSFLTLAIDYRLDAYVQQYLTTSRIKNQMRRPLLDHALRPRFLGTDSMNIGMQLPNARLAAHMIHLGADPNERCQSSSVWSLYLCLLNDYILFLPLEVMIRGNAASQLPKSWLCVPGRYHVWGGFQMIPEILLDWEDQDRLFRRRWPGIQPIETCSAMDPTSEVMYDVGDLLEHFREYFGEEITRVTELLRQMESQRTKAIISNGPSGMSHAQCAPSTPIHSDAAVPETAWF